MATTADLRLAALQNIGEVAAGETPSAEDQVLVDRVILNTVADYSIDGISIDLTDVPDFIFESLAAVIAALIAGPFEKNEAEIQRLNRAARSGDLNIRNRMGPKKGHEPVEANYF